MEQDEQGKKRTSQPRDCKTERMRKGDDRDRMRREDRFEERLGEEERMGRGANRRKLKKRFEGRFSLYRSEVPVVRQAVSE
jgi:hypothetical protein